MNDSDGDTCLFDGDNVVARIKPKKGRGVAFDGRWKHASSSPVETPFRCIFNFNLKPEIPAEAFSRYAAIGA